MNIKKKVGTYHQGGPTGVGVVIVLPTRYDDSMNVCVYGWIAPVVRSGAAQKVARVLFLAIARFFCETEEFLIEAV